MIICFYKWRMKMRLTYFVRLKGKIIFLFVFFSSFWQDDFAENKEFITVHVYKSDGGRVYYPSKSLKCVLRREMLNGLGHPWYFPRLGFVQRRWERSWRVLELNQFTSSRVNNRPFPNYLWPLFQGESWCSSFLMKISFHTHANEN